MGYYFYFSPENKIVVVGYTESLEKNLISQEASGRVVKLKEIQDEEASSSENTSKFPIEVEGFEPPPQEDIALVRRSVRTHRAHEHLCLNVEAEEHSLGDLNESTNYKVALLDLESNKWLNDMNSEMHSIKDNQVWHLVDLPPNVKGYTQTYMIDYKETFSPVTNIRAIRILIAIVPFCFIDPKHPRKVCKLQRSIYGLKQASRRWNKIFDEEIKKFDFSQNLDEPCVYQKASGSNVTFLVLYVDDIIIMGNNIPMLQSVKSYLGKCFTMKDLGEAAFILGIKIYRDRSTRLI
ncbi:retrotransposon protein, putative, ty1-copia subclass [Tanacetum coccineum]